MESGNNIPEGYQVVGDPLIGGMGVVYLCLDLVLDRPVALKTFNADILRDRKLRAAFLSEATIWMELGRHPHIVHAYGFKNIVSKVDYLVLEQVVKGPGRRGASLRHVMVPEHPLAVAESLLYGIQIARGLKHAETMRPGLVHRDIKPENVLLGADRLSGWPVGRARVTDFGLAAVLQVAMQTRSTNLSANSTQWIKGKYGTPQYMAPEQWQAGEICTATDIYALGCVLFEMLTGRTAAGDSSTELENVHCSGRLRRWTRPVPPSVREMVGNCLHTDARLRFQSWSEAEAALVEQYQLVSGLAAPSSTGSSKVARGDRVALGWGHFGLGDAYLNIARPDNASSCYKRALAVGSDEGDSGLKAAGLYGLGKASYDVGDFRAALVFFGKMSGLERQRRDRHGQVHALLEAGMVRCALGDHRSGIRNFEEALLFFREVGDMANIAATLSNLGFAFVHLGEVRSAVKCHNEALRISRKAGLKSFEGHALGGLGFSHLALGEVRKAIMYYEGSLRIARSHADRRSEGHVLGSLASCYGGLGDQRTSLTYSLEARNVFHESGDKRAEMVELNTLGCAYAALGESSQSLECYQQSLSLALEIQSLRGKALALCNIGCAHVDLGDAALGLDFVAQALKIQDKLDDPHATAGMILELGRAQLANGKYREAVDSFKAALKFAKKLTDQSLQAKVHWALGVAHETQGDLRHATAAMQKCIVRERELRHQDLKKHEAQLLVLLAKIAADT